MGRDKDRLGAEFQHDLQQVAAVQPQDRPSIRMDISDGLQLPGYHLRLLKVRKQNQAVYLPHSSVLFIDGTDLSGNHESGNYPICTGFVLNPVLLL